MESWVYFSKAFTSNPWVDKRDWDLHEDLFYRELTYGIFL